MYICIMSKTYRHRVKEYPVYNELPANALTVAEYCIIRGCSNPYIYKLHRTGKADFKIIVFKNINFIIPN
jgi:hypothetical protein